MNDFVCAYVSALRPSKSLFLRRQLERCDVKINVVLAVMQLVAEKPRKNYCYAIISSQAY